MNSRDENGEASGLTGLSEAVVDGIQDQDRVQMRREQICQAALELFLEKGFASTTIRDICARSGVNQASIYDYIANKHDILRRLLNQLWFRTDVPTLPDYLDRETDASFEESVRSYLEDVWDKKRQAILLSYRAVPHLRDEDRRAMREREERLMGDLASRLKQRAGLKADDQRAEVVANMILFLTAFAPMRDWLTKDIDEDVLQQTVSSSIAAIVDRLGQAAAMPKEDAAKREVDLARSDEVEARPGGSE